MQKYFLKKSNLLCVFFVAGCWQARVLDRPKHGEESSVEGRTYEREGSHRHTV